MMDHDTTIKFVIAHQLLNSIELRDADCNRLTFDLGEPDAEGFYTPVITRHYDDNPLAELKARRCAGCGNWREAIGPDGKPNNHHYCSAGLAQRHGHAGTGLSPDFACNRYERRAP